MTIGTFGLNRGVGEPISIPDRTVSDTGAAPVAAIRYGNDGVTTVPAGTPSPAVGADEWLLAALQGSGAGNPYEIYAEYISGDPLTGGSPTNQWRPLSDTQFWEQAATTADRFTTLDITIRRVGTTTPVYGPGRVTLTANVV